MDCPPTGQVSCLTLQRYVGVSVGVSVGLGVGVGGWVVLNVDL
jgi:hypothetical protein